MVLYATLHTYRTITFATVRAGEGRRRSEGVREWVGEGERRIYLGSANISVT